MQKYRQLIQYARRQRGVFVLIFVLTLAASALVALQPWPMKLLVDHLLGKQPLPGALQSTFGLLGIPSTPTALLLVITLGILGLFGLNTVLEITLAYFWTAAGRRMVYDLAEDLFARLQRRSVLFHSRSTVGDTMSRITVDSWSVYQVLDALCFAPLHALLAMVGMVFLMWQLDVMLTLLALAIAPFMVGASFLVGKPLRAAAKLRREIESRIQSHIQQTLTGIPVVQAFVQEERQHARLEQFANAAIRAQQRSVLVGSVNSLSSGLITTLGTGLILWVGARHVIDNQLTVGGIWVFLVYLTSLQTQMRVLANTHTALQTCNASVDRVMEVLGAEPEVAEKPGAIQLPPARGEVQIENVTFGYEPGQPVLRGVSLSAYPGRILAVVGATGAGKSTLVSLVPRFFDPWQGRVLVDGHDVRDLRLKSLRDQVSLVLQEPFLFPISIADNIAYGRPNASRKEIEAVARAANAHDFIERLPQTYDTLIGERGATLSGGERQRLAIARAMLKDAPILILDEPTSALDGETERLVLEALERLMRNRTTLIIAHRLSTIRRADRIVLLANGQIAESGTHEELLSRGDLYAHWHQRLVALKPEAAGTAG
jgi:ATP-binding cassette subfamily B protein/subfamily B ATP-binding cassette protein MsbA